MTVAEIIREYLKEKGYDGLFNSDAECACLVSDLCPGCGCPYDECEPGYRKECDCGEGHGFHIAAGSPKPFVKSDHKIEMRVVDGDMAWMFYLSIDGEDVVRQFVTPAKGMIINKYIGRK